MKRIFALLIIVLGSLYCNAQDYVPLVREGVKWKCGMLVTLPDSSFITAYTILFKGDTIIEGYSYKNCIVIPEGYSDEISDSTVCGFAREDIAAKKVYFRCNENYCPELPFYELPCAYLDYSDKNTQRTDEVLLYDFNDITQSIELRPENLQVYEYDSVIIDYEENSGRLYKRYNVGSELTVIEGVGCGGTVPIYGYNYLKTGDLINMLPLLTAGMTQEYHIFYHLEDADGNIIYDAPSDPPSYVPLTREDIKWKYTRVFNPEVPEAMERVPYTLELKGDTIIYGSRCKKIIWTNEMTGEQVVDKRFIYERIIEKYAFVIEKGEYYYNSYCLYGFDNINKGKYCGDVDVSVMQDSTIMLGDVKTVCHKFDYGDGRKYSFIEGVGFVNETPNKYGEYDGNLLCFLQGTDPEASYYDVFLHLEDADGNILYTAPKSPYGFDGIGEVAKAGEDAVEVARYDVHGRRLAKPVPGINIIKMSDGTVRKQLHRE